MPASRSLALPLPRNSLKIAAAAFCAGLLLFLLVWLKVRDQAPQPAAAAAQPQAEASVDSPLPEPLPASAGASDMPDARPQAVAEEKPQLVETAPAAPPPQPLAEAPAAAPAAAATAPAAASDRPVPLPGQAPPTDPPAALRRGESGTVVVRVEVDAGGMPLDAKIIQRSGSRDLDRAALNTVRRWRFQPAQSNGQPMAGSVDIPFDFKPM